MSGRLSSHWAAKKVQLWKCCQGCNMESDHLPTYFGIGVGAAIALLAVDLNLATQTSDRWRFWIFYSLLVAACAISYWLWMEIRRDPPLLKIDGAIVESVVFGGLTPGPSIGIRSTTTVASGTGSPGIGVFSSAGFSASMATAGGQAEVRPTAYLFVTNLPRRRKSTRIAKSGRIQVVSALVQ